MCVLNAQHAAWVARQRRDNFTMPLPPCTPSVPCRLPVPGRYLAATCTRRSARKLSARPFSDARRGRKLAQQIRVARQPYFVLRSSVPHPYTGSYRFWASDAASLFFFPRDRGGSQWVDEPFEKEWMPSCLLGPPQFVECKLTVPGGPYKSRPLLLLTVAFSLCNSTATERMASGFTFEAFFWSLSPLIPSAGSI